MSRSVELTMKTFYNLRIRGSDEPSLLSYTSMVVDEGA